MHCYNKRSKNYKSHNICAITYRLLSMKEKNSDLSNQTKERPTAKRVFSTIGDVKTDEIIKDESDDTRVLKRPNISCPPDALSRNKRLFGNLMGHLGTAKKNIEKDTKLEIQNAAISSVAVKHNNESHRLREHHDKLRKMEKEKVILLFSVYMVISLRLINLTTRCYQEVNLKKKLDIQKKVNDIRKDSKSWSSTLDTNANCVFTKFSPCLKWEPCRVNETYRKLLDDRKTQVSIYYFDILYLGIIFILFL